MSSARSPLESRLVALERKVFSADRAVRALQRGVADLNQGIWEAWNDDDANVEEVAPPGTCMASYMGTVIGCNSQGVVGATVTVKDHVSGSTLATVTTLAGGAFSGTLAIANPTQSIDVVVSITGWNTKTTNFTFGCGSNSLATINLTIATGYMCLLDCAVPTQATLTVVSSIFGTHTATLSGGVWRTSLFNVNTPAGFGACTAQTGVPFQFVLNGMLMQPQYSANNSTFCPNTAATFFAGASSTLTSRACSPWTATWSATGPPYGTSTDTVTWHL